MVMNMFYIKSSRTADGAFDSRSAPVHRYTTHLCINGRGASLPVAVLF